MAHMHNIFHALTTASRHWLTATCSTLDCTPVTNCSSSLPPVSSPSPLVCATGPPYCPPYFYDSPETVFSIPVLIKYRSQKHYCNVACDNFLNMVRHTFQTYDTADRGVVSANLITIKPIRLPLQTQTRVTLLNVRSLSNKSFICQDIIYSNKFDIFFGWIQIFYH